MYEFNAPFLQAIHKRNNRHHSLTRVNDESEIGLGTYIGGFSEMNAKGARVIIDGDCDIVSLVAVNVADVHLRGLAHPVSWFPTHVFPVGLA